MKKICFYKGCEIFKVAGVYYCTGRIYAKSEHLANIIAVIER